MPLLRGRGEVLDLGCGRGEALAVLAAEGIPARGVDSSAGMVARCRERGLAAAEGDLFALLAQAGEGSQGGRLAESSPSTSSSTCRPTRSTGWCASPTAPWRRAGC